MGALTAAEKESEAREARAASNQARLQKIVLSWDFYRLLALAKIKNKRGKRGDKDEEEETPEGALKLRAVPDKFKDLEEYLSVFEALLLEECRAQIIRGEEEGGGTQCHMVGLATWEKANEFYFMRLAVPADAVEEFMENDLLLLSREKPLGGARLPTTYAFGAVEGREGAQTLRVRMHLDSETSEKDGLTLTPTAAALRLRQALQGPTSAWYIMKLCNMSTILREYTALRSVGSLPFVDVILSAADASKDAAKKKKTQATQPADLGHWNIPQPLKEYLQGGHNSSQMQAIQAGLTRKPLVLIQGPPGTGKTQTILGLLSVILHSTPAKLPAKMLNWMKASPWHGNGINPRDLIMPEDGDDGYFSASHNAFRPEKVGAKQKLHAHVLVCAPSNSALDEIVLRLLRTGLRDEKGMMYTPNIVRVGLNAHHSVQSVSMDTLVQHRLSSTERSAVSAGPRATAGMERDRIRIQILDEAAIVCSTLSFSGAGVFKRMNRGFDVVVIDEAAQAVGDPIQLPATVLSTNAVQHGYGMSLFKRFQQAGYPVQMLNTQYRMHPQIREFPSKEFYHEALVDGDEVELQTTRPWHEHRCFGPFAFLDIAGQESQPPGSGSWVNQDEADFVLVLYKCLVGMYPSLKDGPHLAVISPYKQQVKLIRELFRDAIGVEATKLIDINTVDGFQGREKDIAIFSCVRANPKGGIGFVSDYRRMNVGLTRARASMLVVGCSAALKQDKHWNNLITSAEERRRLLKVSKPYHSLFSDQSLEAMKKLDEEESQLRLLLAEKKAAEKLVEPPKSADVEMDNNDDYPEEEEAEEIGVNFGDFDEEVEDI
ncbi:hypothetical protein AXG93_4874s1030 [Marchantia polymorpha subsp. ruderalis]|uniref:AAA+ ATPase domain-containing protein n=1 Tax=Marchantia polymorpha subsp. ruderalis TaxID=1480154 RepID=A0A176WEV3_MARPO|nr:hypothetical protein AXG93_4874s1030 [Marchantia polymorpha subsp. ruderalis]